MTSHAQLQTPLLRVGTTLSMIASFFSLFFFCCLDTFFPCHAARLVSYALDPALGAALAAPYVFVDPGGGYNAAATRLLAVSPNPGQAGARPLWIGTERVALVLVQAKWGASSFSVTIPAGGYCLLPDTGFSMHTDL